MSEYIDKDALMETLKNVHKRLITIGYTRHTIGFEGAMDYVEEAPPADVVEVRHGEWGEYGENNDNTHNIGCSICGHKIKSKGHANSIYTKSKYRYCPNCGARMDGESDE